ncbi:MAG: glycosyltransferase family 4 protein, partial [Solirubrobacteraceae bacterium]|nr:glycosyltransferase family 4 protein [Patulibacter sp.]
MSRRYLLVTATFAYAREARVAADQLAAVDPDVPRTIVVIDGDPRSLELLAGAGEVVTGADLGLDRDLVGRWAGAYGWRGIVWAAFPHVIRAIGEPGDRVLWIGADVDIAGRPDVLWDAFDEAPVVAARAAPSLAPHEHERPDNANGAPHAFQPVTAVVEHGGELIARSLLGWTVGSPAVERLLGEWPVPRDHPTFEPIASHGIAQQWFNALALADDVAVVRSPGVVLSIAQLLSREVTDDPDGPLVDGAPLSLLGLRGFNAYAPHLLEGRVVTARLSDRPALAPLLRQRAAALLAVGWEEDPPPTLWQGLPEQLPLSDLVRDLIRRGLRSGAITHSPFDPDGFEQLRAYATEPARQGGSIGVNRLLGAVHASRPDLHAAYPALDGPDGLGFLGWAWVHGREELSIPESFLPPRPAFLDAAPAVPAGRDRPDTEGVNLAGYFTSELGLGESARQLAAAFEAAGVATTPVQGLLVPPTRQQAEFVPVGPQDAHHDVNVVVVNGDQMPHFARDVGPGFFDGRPTIAVWWWEVDPFPAAEWAPAMEWVDEIWVGTDFIRSLIEPHVDVPVWVFPVPVAVQRLETPVPRSHFGWSDDETVFLFIWDYHSTEARKNPSGLVEAYRRAFPDDDGSTRLVLKCINHENLPEADEKVRLAAAGRSDITFIDRFLSAREKNSLLELADCYVSPHRSEGFGYTPAEAMLLGKPVVVTGYGGTTEYTDDSVARMVRWTPAKVGRGALPYPPDGTWADPDLDDLTAALRWIVEEPEAVAAMAARGEERIRTQHDIATTGAAMRDRLAVVRARGAAAPAATPSPAEAAMPR